MDIRNDIYPEAQTYLQALISRTQEAYPTIFPTVDDVIRYVNNFKSPKIAGLFLEVGNYYNAAKSSVYAVPKNQKVSGVNALETNPFITLIMAMSIMEKLASLETSGVECWVDFYDWVNRKEIDEEYTQVLRKGKFRDFTALMASLKGRWSKEYADITKITNFLRAAMSPEEKTALVKAIKYMQTAPDLSAQTFTSEEDIKNYVKKNPAKTTEAALPACFDQRQYWKCYTTAPNNTGQGYCCNKSSCPLVADKEKLDKCFKDTVKTIYDWRSRFIHDLQLPPVKEALFYGVQYKGKYTAAELTTAEFKPALEAMVKRFFDNYQITRAKKK